MRASKTSSVVPLISQANTHLISGVTHGEMTWYRLCIIWYFCWIIRSCRTFPNWSAKALNNYLKSWKKPSRHWAPMSSAECINGFHKLSKLRHLSRRSWIWDLMRRRIMSTLDSSFRSLCLMRILYQVKLLTGFLSHQLRVKKKLKIINRIQQKTSQTPCVVSTQKKPKASNSPSKVSSLKSSSFRTSKKKVWFGRMIWKV